jgi:hypothetical protein
MPARDRRRPPPAVHCCTWAATRIAALGPSSGSGPSPEVRDAGLGSAEDRGFEPRRVLPPNRISSSGHDCSDRFKLDQPSRPVFPGWCRTVLNCNPNCNPQIRRSEQVVQDHPPWFRVLGPIFHSCPCVAGFVRRQGSSFGSSHDRTAAGAFPPAGQPDLDAVAYSGVLHVCGLARRGHARDHRGGPGESKCDG